jgi:hypothetical protein
MSRLRPARMRQMAQAMFLKRSDLRGGPTSAEIVATFWVIGLDPLVRQKIMMMAKKTET